MNIFATIGKTASDVCRDTGKMPTRVYLGRNQMAAARAAFYRDTVSAPATFYLGNQRPKIGGLDVYEVDADDHLAVGA